MNETILHWLHKDLRLVRQQHKLFQGRSPNGRLLPETIYTIVPSTLGHAQTLVTNDHC